jgi:protein-tyrosine-phosphatase
MADIIFICNANRCRSPMAEAILKKGLAENGLLHLAVSSMGIHAQEGEPATEFAIAVCREQGIDLERHRSRHLIPDELKMSHLILTMEPVQVDYIDIFFPQVSDRLFMLASWPDRKGKKASIPDPVGKSINAHRKTFQLLREHIDFLLPEVIERYRNF